jgi:hypothetical protein
VKAANNPINNHANTGIQPSIVNTVPNITRTRIVMKLGIFSRANGTMRIANKIQTAMIEPITGSVKPKAEANHDAKPPRSMGSGYNSVSVLHGLLQFSNT